jgi:hypothetical protein
MHKSNLFLKHDIRIRRPLSAPGFRDVDELARGLAVKPTGVRGLLKNRTAMPADYDTTLGGAPGTSLDALLGKHTEEWDLSEDEDYKHHGEWAIMESDEPTDPSNAHRPATSSSSTAKHHQWQNAPDSKKFKSVAVSMEAKLLELVNLPKRSDAGPTELKTAACCQLLRQLCGHLGYFEPILNRLSKELFASIYQDYDARQSGCERDAADEISFDSVPFFVVVRSMQEELSLVKRDKAILQQRSLHFSSQKGLLTHHTIKCMPKHGD